MYGVSLIGLFQQVGFWGKLARPSILLTKKCTLSNLAAQMCITQLVATLESVRLFAEHGKGLFP
jgi:hypothetical protein